MIRRFRPEDEDCVCSLESGIFREHNPYEYVEFYQMFEDGFFVEDIGGMIAGFVVGYPLSDVEGHIFSLAVHEDFRRQGIGEALLDHICLYFMLKGLSKVSLEVRVSNQAAIRLYTKAGFSIAWKELKYYSDGEDGYVMTALLNEYFIRKGLLTFRPGPGASEHFLRRSAFLSAMQPSKEFFRNDHFFNFDRGERLFPYGDVKESPDRYGTAPEDRPIREYIEKGVVVINKPAGPTSHEIAAYVKKILEVDLAGHSGSLDPVVTGVQPVMISKATRAVAAIRLSGKEYICLLKLHRSVPKKTIEKTLSEFTGTVWQMPPVTSAVKRTLRARHIYYIEPLEFKDTYVLMRVGCEAGTYIRKLCHDIGMALGVGGHMQELIRSKAGPFTEEGMTTLQELEDAYAVWKDNGDESELRRLIRPMETSFAQIPSVTVRNTAVGALCHGAFLARPGIISLDSGLKKGDMVAVFSGKGEIISLSEALMDAAEVMEKESGFVARPVAVLMEPGRYPWVSRNKKEETPASGSPENTARSDVSGKRISFSAFRSVLTFFRRIRNPYISNIPS